MAAAAQPDAANGAGELVERLCQFVLGHMTLSGCALVLMLGAESASVLAGAGRHAQTVAGLQMELGEGPCLHAHASRIPVLLPDLTAGRANRWPTFGGSPGGRRARRVLVAVDRGGKRYRHIGPVP
jgi:hypothetical protein